MLKIDDRKAAVGEMGIDSLVGVRERTLFVRTSVVEASTHLLRCRAPVNLLVGTRDATHWSAPRGRCDTTLGTPDDLLIDLDVTRGLMLPGQRVLDASSPG